MTFVYVASDDQNNKPYFEWANVYTASLNRTKFAQKEYIGD